MISVYNRYSAYGGQFRRVPPPRQQPHQEGAAPPRGQEPGRDPSPPVGRYPARQTGLFGLLNNLSFGDMDFSDLMLAAILFFLYLESRDEDFLIMLAVVFLSPGNGGDAH